ncbi:rRNA small subunit methyltransferase B [Nostocoides sp. F2B08]|uniref:RsmB/NOP family class I SAM-dependent RNA methyltransferase n=1 Tax=Nostocoides sp. F2B08 TaxID=2653936 RepID=UPI0012631383|nr:RsmB/NOP family class I SAM-dependent RNA methyltransferase [Tetrasphaera sp. F2B08]KAB7744589.1 rRNA small subunit methyltransferase B [Tetrasphaera sp. F2B08]
MSDRRNRRGDGHGERSAERAERSADRDESRPRRSGSGRSHSTQAPRDRRRTGDPARHTAYRVMRAVSDGAYTNLELTQALRRAGLDTRDAAFVTELVSGATRWRGRYDAIIAVAADRDTSALDPAVLDTLRLGAHQLLAMRVPQHAAVGETVGLARAVNGIGPSKLVNAVLRRISERSLDEWLARTVPDEPPTARLAALHSHPEWVVKALRQALLAHGSATPDTVDDELDALLAVDNVAPPVHLVARPGLGAEEELRAAGAREHPLGPTAWILDGGDPGRIAAVRDGRAAVQDAGSQLLAIALATVPLTGTAAAGHERWLDLCAGPGGKAGLLAALALSADADLVAGEVNPRRAELVRSTLSALEPLFSAAGRSVQVRVADGRETGAGEPERYTRVLVDAPCTGLGALRRRPEARWRRQPTDLATLGPLQRDLLHSALDATVPGGVVAYATCSPHPAETSLVVSDVLRRRGDAERIDAREYLLDRDGHPIGGVGPGPAVQLWPHRHGTDAMFLTLIRRSAAVSSST